MHNINKVVPLPLIYTPYIHDVKPFSIFFIANNRNFYHKFENKIAQKTGCKYSTTELGTLLIS